MDSEALEYKGRDVRPCVKCRNNTPVVWQNCCITKEPCDEWLAWLKTATVKEIEK